MNYLFTFEIKEKIHFSVLLPDTTVFSLPAKAKKRTEYVYLPGPTLTLTLMLTLMLTLALWVCVPLEKEIY